MSQNFADSTVSSSARHEHPILAFVGGGAMGEAILKALLQNAVLQPSQIRVSEPDDARRSSLREKYGVETYVDNAACVDGVHVVVLAVKPQVAPAVLAGLTRTLSPDSLVFSIMAGVTIATLRAGLHEAQPVIRTMPNMPAQIGQGMTAWLPTDNVRPEQLFLARQILAALGDEVQVANEDYIDKATAVHGSGPAYVFLLLEAMVDAAVHLGFMRPVAERLVLQTFRGSVEYAQQSPQHLAALRNQVTSAGGTTAAGLYELEKAGVRTAMADAVWAAYRRSVELGKK
ncbi:MAG: pyrroline-5-carboxylate reductase [Chloroflexi bacterium]|nr:pyrroline-5-carboxylate reductase [Chloroflexota bacterium]